jgi:hypothetical protein
VRHGLCEAAEPALTCRHAWPATTNPSQNAGTVTANCWYSNIQGDQGGTYLCPYDGRSGGLVTGSLSTLARRYCPLSAPPSQAPGGCVAALYNNGG